MLANSRQADGWGQKVLEKGCAGSTEQVASRELVLRLFCPFPVFSFAIHLPAAFRLRFLCNVSDCPYFSSPSLSRFPHFYSLPRNELPLHLFHLLFFGLHSLQIGLSGRFRSLPLYLCFCQCVSVCACQSIFWSVCLFVCQWLDLCVCQTVCLLLLLLLFFSLLLFSLLLKISFCNSFAWWTHLLL